MNLKQADAWLCETLRHGGTHFQRAWIAGGRVWVVTADEGAALAINAIFKRMAILTNSQTMFFKGQWITNAKMERRSCP